MGRIYICIDLKSFFASVECSERGLDAMTTNLAVCDLTRSEKTICLAITPAMKALGIKNRCRVFEIPKNVEYIAAPPRMQLYIDYAAKIYAIYLRYISKEDIYVYSIDEAFMDVTDYLLMYNMTARELGQTIMETIYYELHIRATCGIGTNLYLAKIALDITAKHAADFIGELTEESFINDLGKHRPLTDFWRIGPGISRRLAQYGIYTNEDIRNADTDLLYRLFGVDAELLIDHAYGREPVTIKDIKSYRPSTSSISSGQVLMRDYSYSEARLIIKEMTDLMCLDIVDKDVYTDSVSLTLIYSNESGHPASNKSVKLPDATDSDLILIPRLLSLYDGIASRFAPIRKINISFNNLKPKEFVQYDFFTDPATLEKNNRMQKAVIDIKKRFGKNAILKGMNLEKGGTTIERNMQIGGHRSGIETDTPHEHP
ncbi:MAG: DNA repair protein [Lachnospiraceae bacterium]|nr:DNA repair protein [Lachnospiraceae bacterium]